LASLVKICPLRASVASFFRLIVDHLECPLNFSSPIAY
jgi:hypothetical protein